SGVDSGLIDSQTGNHVFLFLESGQVVGREGANSGAAAGGPIDFKLSVDASGNITLTDLRSVHQGAGETGDINEGTSLNAGLVSLTATVTDINNASASANVDSGLIDSGTGQHIFLVLNGNTVEGHVGASSTLAFTLALDTSTGVVTLTDLRAMHQGSPDTPTDISEGVSLNNVANLVTLT